MLKHHISLSFRHLKKSKLSLFVNIIGLTLGIVCVVLIYLFVSSHLGYDAFHKNADNLYRVVRDDMYANTLYLEAGSPVPLARTIRAEIPEVKQATMIHDQEEQLLSVGDKKIIGERLVFVEPEFFEMFDVNWIAGNGEEFSVKNKMALTPEMAIQLFGTEDAIGKIVKYNNRLDFEVVGLIEKSNPKSHFRYNFLCSFESLDKEMFGHTVDTWRTTMSSIEAFVLLPEHVSVETINQKLNELNRRHVDKRNYEIEKYYLQHMKDVHFATEYASFGQEQTVSRKYLWIFSGIGLVILLLACINFVNLSLAGLLEQKKEIAIFKSLSATKSHIIKQVLTETSIVILGALLLAVVILEIISTPVFSKIGMNLQYSIIDNPGHILAFIIAGIAIILIAGMYPAFLISKQNPIEAFNSLKSRAPGGVGFMRNALVLFQFTVSVILITCAVMISKQMFFIENTDLGFHKDGIVEVYLPKMNERQQKLLKQRLSEIPTINNSSLCIGAPVAFGNLQTNYNFVDTIIDNDALIGVKAVDENYHKTFGLKLLAGEWINNTESKDTVTQFVLSRQAVERLEINEPYKIIGRHIGIFRSKALK